MCEKSYEALRTQWENLIGLFEKLLQWKLFHWNCKLVQRVIKTQEILMKINFLSIALSTLKGLLCSRLELKPFLSQISNTYFPNTCRKWYLSSMFMICLSISLWPSFRTFLPESFLPNSGIVLNFLFHWRRILTPKNIFYLTALKKKAPTRLFSR